VPLPDVFGRDRLEQQMERPQRAWNDVRGSGFLIAVTMALTASIIAWAALTALTAKSPGESHCYKDVCHRVYTLDETRRMIGQSVELHATHYDDPSIDKMNVGELTSSGEVFDASNPGRTSASNYPDGTELLLWNAATKRASHVRVNDFGPFWGKRTIDVTRRVADDLGFAKAGVAQLRVTVIWVPPPQAARYRKYRSYPMSFGLLGVVEAEQLEPLAQRLIFTADQRNRELMPRPIEPPDFAAEAAVVAAADAALMPRRLAALMAGLPKVDLGAQPIDLHRRIYVGPPGLRVEATLDVPRATGAANARLAEALATTPRHASLLERPADLETPAPIVIAAIAPRPPRTLPGAGEADTTTKDDTTQDVVGKDVSVTRADEPRVALAGPTAPNRSRVFVESVPVEGLRDLSGDTRPQTAVASASAASPTVASPAIASERAPALRQVDPSARVSVAVAQSQFEYGHGGLSLWIGIAVMLTTFLSVAGLARRRKGAKVLAANSEVSSVAVEPQTSAAAQDALAVARNAAARAEAEAREVLARETAARSVASLAEAQAREDLSREIARRETDRETQMRLRFEVAAEAQAEALRELEAIDAARRARAAAAVIPDVKDAPVVAAAPTVQVARAVDVPPAAPISQVAVPAPLVAQRAEPVSALMPAPMPAPKAIVVEPPPPVFPGVSDPKLAAAILGRPGASTYWGNTIIAQARLDGTARSGSPLRIDGVVDGAVYAPVILVSEGATVTGVIAADTIIVLGTVSGTLSGRKVTVAKSAQVEGEIFYQTMSIDPHAQCDVRFRRLTADADPVAVGTAVFNGQVGGRPQAA
jgi:cytoskeletal protein CcmA (bactofilin family)